MDWCGVLSLMTSITLLWSSPAGLGLADTCFAGLEFTTKKTLSNAVPATCSPNVGVKDLENFKVNSMEFPNGTLPGFFSPLPGD